MRATTETYFRKNYHDGEAEIHKYNGKELELLLFSSNQFTAMKKKAIPLQKQKRHH
jgi:hypothetical protein